MNDINFFYETFELTSNQKEQYEEYYKLIYDYNQKMNLTGIDDKVGVYLKHFYDSLLIAPNIPTEKKKVADLGSGAGFPGIVLAIYYPNNKFYLIEPTKKRCDFLEIVINELKLHNVEVINERAEALQKEQYDIVVSRAVASLNILLELSIPILKTNGLLIAQKGKQGKEELKKSKEALKTLKSSLVKAYEEELPFEKSRRYNILIKKDQNTPDKYPRNYGQIKKAPL